MSLEEKKCEELYETSYRRDNDGRYIVKLPFREPIQILGDSKTAACKRLQYLEKKLSNNPDLKASYINFMREYIDLGHMKLCQSNSQSGPDEYFLSHHAVCKPASTSTKLRVVFDALAKTSTNLSLNDILMVGPVVQQELFSIILRFRKFVYAFTTDVEKMYRQIKICDDHKPYQKILWRKNETEPIQEYSLQTVTYGTSAAPYLATKTLLQLAHDEECNYPLASKVTIESFYVDDLLAGSDTINEALEIQEQLIKMFESAGMTLRKWSSNTNMLLQRIPIKDQEPVNESNDTIKTLGLIWNAKNDSFIFNIAQAKTKLQTTKRETLSSIAKLFDPLGLIAPVIITAKILMQQIWLSRIKWDDQLPDNIQILWNTFYNNLPLINDIQIKRRVIGDEAKQLEIHGFADASSSAYGACVYIRSINKHNDITVNLLCGKSRVAPLKVTSIPRLELNAALLLSVLVKKVIESMNINVNEIYLWSDSTIVLSWLKLAPYKLKTYVANRICEIQEITSHMTWRHVDSKNNARDVVSRGRFSWGLVCGLRWRLD